MQGDKERVLEKGFSGYIPKPFSVTTFVQDIEKILGTLDNHNKEQGV
jgi:CheY-like chemotaxis protein